MNTLDKKLVRELQKGIKLEVRPFLRIAKEVGISEDEVIAKVKEFQEKGIIRRIGAAVKPTEAGFACNALVAWEVPAAQVESVGKFMTDMKEISHCYERTCPPGWIYNVFSMIHAVDEKNLEEIIARIKKECGIASYKIYRSLKEYKKSSMQYFMDEKE